MNKKSIVLFFIIFTMGAISPLKAEQRPYDTLLYSEIERLPFHIWWSYLKDIAEEEGVYIDDSDEGYFRVYYFDEGYSPEEAFEEEYY